MKISASGASGRNRMKYISGLTIDGQAIDQTYLPESITQSGGELAFSLSAKFNQVWGTAERSAPPSFGAGSLAVTVNVSPAAVAIAPGSTRTVTVNAQRMIDGPGDYSIYATSYSEGITAASVSGKFAADGSATAKVAVRVAQSVSHGYYPLVLTTRNGASARTFMLLVAVGEAGIDQWLTGWGWAA